MKISYNWLKEFINLKERPIEIAKLFSLQSAEVEEVIDLAKNFKGVIVGEIKEIKKHPYADKLFISTVNIGKKTIQVIFGQMIKLQKGQKIPLAVAPTKIAAGEIKKVKIRGIVSEGMICLNQELGILDESKNICFFDKSIRPGTSLAKALGLEDFIFEIENKSLTHRPDLFSHLGFAKELGAIKGRELKELKLKKPKTKQVLDLKVEIKDKNLCSRYMAVVLDGIKVRPSPLWMQARLSSCGIRSINNVVDITNYVMLELGQPLHAFDYEKLENKTILVRCAKKDEKIKTLDGQVRNLDSSMLVIADSQKPIALAGIMGGANSNVSQNTKTIVLESANFNKALVRKTAVSLGLRTEAAMRFEKGLPLVFSEQGLLRCIELLEKYTQAKVSSKIFSFSAQKLKSPKIQLDLNYLVRLLGVRIHLGKIIKILKFLQFKVKKIRNGLEVEPPLFRTDICIPEDVIEEIVRIYGYNNVKSREIKATLSPVKELPDLFWSKKICQILAGLGFSEVYNYSFYGEKLLSKCFITSKDHLELENPLSEDLRFLRTSLLPQLLTNASLNLKNFKSFKLFEIGHVYMPGCESRVVSGIGVGSKEDVFYEVKGALEILLKRLNISFEMKRLEKTMDCDYWNMYAQGKSLQILSGQHFLGTLSLTDQRVLANFDIRDKEVAFFSLSIDLLGKLATAERIYKPFPKYPSVILDLAFIVDEGILAEDIQTAIKEAGQPLLSEIELFDVYYGKPLAPNKKNLAFHLTFQAVNRTLTDKEIEGIQRKIIRKLNNKFKAQVRAF